MQIGFGNSMCLQATYITKEVIWDDQRRLSVLIEFAVGRHLCSTVLIL